MKGAAFPPVAATGTTDFGNRARLLWIGRCCIGFSVLLLLCFAPLVLGGRHPMGRLALATAALPGCVGVLLNVWGGRRIPLRNVPSCLLVACLLIPLVQLVPLPPQTTAALQPGTTKLLDNSVPLVASVAERETLSLSPGVTAGALPLILTYIAIFIMLVTAIESHEDCERLLAMLTVSALLLAAIALLQAHFGNGRFLWLYAHPSRDPGTVPRGPFQNENHLCSLLAAAFPVACYFLLRQTAGFSKRQGRQKPAKGETRLDRWRWLAVASCVATISTVYATPSRGGAALVALSAAIAAAIYGWYRLGVRCFPQRVGVWMAAGISAAGATGTILFILLLENLQAISYWRHKIWMAGLAAWRDFPYFGTGIGTHRFVYRAYIDEHFHQTFSTAESSWLQFLIETGIVGFAVAVLAASVVCSYLIRAIQRSRSQQELLLTVAVAAGLAVSGLHAVVDFPWHIPACFVVVVVLAAVGVRLGSLDTTFSGSVKTVLWGSHLQAHALAILLLAGNLWSIYAFYSPAQASLTWDRYRHIVGDVEKASGSQEAAGEEAGTSRRSIELLHQTLQRDPQHILARTALAIRLTAEYEASRAHPHAAKKWAQHAFHHCVKLVALCPTESQSYLCASIVSGEFGTALEQQEQLLQQSSRLRLVDGRVFLRLGLNAAMQGKTQAADEHFKAAISRDPQFREHVLGALCNVYNPADIVRKWHPERDAAQTLYQIAKRRGDQKATLFVGRYLCRQLIEDAARTRSEVLSRDFLLVAQKVADRLPDPSLQQRVLEQQIAHEPYRVDLRVRRVEQLLQAGDYAGAKEDLDYCLDAAPRDKNVRQLVMRYERLARTARVSPAMDIDASRASY